MRLDGEIEYEFPYMLVLLQHPKTEPHAAGGLRCYYVIGGPTYGDWLGRYEQWRDRYATR